MTDVCCATADNKRRGFTLMELLIVVAIIAVLVAVAIPLFANQLARARAAKDAANIRSGYAKFSAMVLTDPSVTAGMTDEDTLRYVLMADGSIKPASEAKATSEDEIYTCDSNAEDLGDPGAHIGVNPICGTDDEGAINWVKDPEDCGNGIVYEYETGNSSLRIVSYSFEAMQD